MYIIVHVRGIVAVKTPKIAAPRQGILPKIAVKKVKIAVLLRLKGKHRGINK